MRQTKWVQKRVGRRLRTLPILLAEQEMALLFAFSVVIPARGNATCGTQHPWLTIGHLDEG